MRPTLTTTTLEFGKSATALFAEDRESHISDSSGTKTRRSSHCAAHLIGCNTGNGTR